MNREFLLNIIFLVFINLLVKPFFIFGVDLTVQNRVGTDYGLYFTLFNFTYLFQILNDFGIQNFNNRHVSRNPQLLAKYFPRLLSIKLVLSVLYITLTFAAAWLIAGYKGRALPLLGILAFNQALVQITLFLRSNISGLGHYRLDSFLSALDKLLMLLLCGILLWSPLFDQTAFSVERFALAQTLALLLTSVIVWLTLRAKTKTPLRLDGIAQWRAKWPELVYLFRKSFPYALVILLMTAYTRLDAVLIERLLPNGIVHADVYAGAYRLLDAVNMIGYLFASLLLPMFARMLKNKEPVRPLTELSFNMIWAGSVTLAAAVCFARADLVQLMMPERASDYRWDTLGILIWTFVPVSVTYIFSTLLTADERLMQMNRFFVGGLFVSVALNLLLIPRWGALGAAISTLVTQTLIALAMARLCIRYFAFRLRPGGSARIIGFTSFILIANYLLFGFVAASWIWKFAFSLGAGGAAALAFGLLDWTKWKRLEEA